MHNDAIRLTVLYDNYSSAEGTRADWGFACLVEGLDRTILFDTGADSSILKQNMNILRVDPSSIDQIVISHMHWDHTGGLDYILGRTKHATVFLPPGAEDSFVEKIKSENHQVRQYKDPQAIQDNVFLSGELGVAIREQSLIIDTSEGLIVLTGCSHPGITDILRRARTIIDKDIALAAGGFHLLRKEPEAVQQVLEEFEEIGVKRCGASHCTGDEAISIMREHFGERYMPLGTGTVLQMSL